MKRGEQTKLIRELESEHGLKPSKTIISRMIKEKDYRIKLTPKGNIDIEPTIKALLDSDFGSRGKKVNETIAAKKGIPAEAETKKQVGANLSTPEEKLTQEDVDKSPLKESDDRQKIERYLSFQKYEKERIANERSKKELVSFSEIAEAVFKFLRPFRDDIQALHGRVAGTARVAGSKHKAEKIIKKETDRILLSRIGKEYSFDDRLKKKIIEILKRSLSRR